MKHLLLYVFGFCVLCCCSHGPTPEEVAGQTAKAYYDLLIQGKYDQFVDGRYHSDSIPSAYREQLITNAKMFAGWQKKERQGILNVRVMDVKTDTINQDTNVLLEFTYGDSTNEVVMVPMVEQDGVWYMR
ncbi:MAG: hypothetical protein ACOYJK_09460 [Prevotella sp.]|jgi:hypothetical protein